RQIHSVSAPIYSRDPTGNSIFVSRTVFGARPAAAFWWTFWCRTLVIFRVVDTKTAHARICRSRDASCLHAAGKAGLLLAVVAVSVSSIPSTRSPRIAPKVAIRWSAYESKVAAGSEKLTVKSKKASPSRTLAPNFTDSAYHAILLSDH